MNKKYEIRMTEAAPVADDSRVIRGYAIVWDVESRVLADWNGEFVEIIERGAVTPELIAQSDVRALFNHIDSHLLARSVNGEGTLKLFIDERGLAFEFEAPNTTVGNDVLELVRRGDLRGCSFAFTVDEADVTYYKQNDVRYRRVHKLSGLYDVSVVVTPAYTQTSVDARSFDSEPPSGEPEEMPVSDEVHELRRFVREMEIIR